MTHIVHVSGVDTCRCENIIHAASDPHTQGSRPAEDRHLGVTLGAEPVLALQAALVDNGVLVVSRHVQHARAHCNVYRGIYFPMLQKTPCIPNLGRLCHKCHTFSGN